MVKVTYEATYATRGQSGIPKDAMDTAICLSNISAIDLDIVFSPKSYSARGKILKPSAASKSRELGKAIRENSGRSLLPLRIEKILSLAQMLSFSRKVRTYEVSGSQKQFILEELFKNKITNQIKVSLMQISLVSRFGRPKFLGRYKLKLTNSEVFIQQQIDPITVPRKTRHFVRLHDVLPITHPQYFDDIAVQVFGNGLEKMLGKNIDWVMDTEASALEFKSMFPREKKVHVIPCRVNFPDTLSSEVLNKKINQIIMVNTIEPRKQIQLAINAFLYARELGFISNSWNLVIIGKSGWQSEELMKRLRSNFFGQNVRYLEDVSDAQVAEEFGKSKLVLSTSRAEGFGIPPLEGMAWGCIPVVSKIPQHLENIGEFGHYFKNFNEIEVANAIKEAISASVAGKQKVLAASMHAYIKNEFSMKVIESKWEQLIVIPNKLN